MLIGSVLADLIFMSNVFLPQALGVSPFYSGASLVNIKYIFLLSLCPVAEAKARRRGEDWGGETRRQLFLAVM